MGGDDGHSAVPVGCPTFTSRAECYAACLEESKALVSGSSELYGSLCNVASVLFYNLNALANAGGALHALDVNWVGFYLLHSPQELLLGPFQGKVACQRIKVGKGVCGTSVLFKKNQAVPDVHAVPGHIACDAGSESEVVVLVREPSGRIVGLLDIDSTKKGFFSDADIAPLEAVCAHLGATFDGKFPLAAAAPPMAATAMKHPGAVAPGAGLTATQLPTKVPAFHVGAAPHPAARQPAPATAAVQHHPMPGGAGAPKAKTTVVEVRPWEFQAVQQDLMLRSTAFPELEARFGVKMLPEIIFAENRLNFVCPLQGAPIPPGPDAPEGRPGPRLGIARLRVSAFDAIEDAARFYKTPDFDAVRDCVAVPAAASWDKFRDKMQSFDPSIDWAFRSRYTGTVDFTPIDATAPSPLPRKEVPAGSDDPRLQIDWDMLKRTDVPIRFYSALDLFEDDLHDGGLSRLSVKTRAMDTCFFVLLRHVVRVDGTILIVRDVRVFHSMASSPPTIVFEECEKQVTLQERIDACPNADVEQLRREMARDEECLPHMRTSFERRTYVELPTTL